MSEKQKQEDQREEGAAQNVSGTKSPSQLEYEEDSPFKLRGMHTPDTSVVAVTPSKMNGENTGQQTKQAMKDPNTLQATFAETSIAHIESSAVMPSPPLEPAGTIEINIVNRNQLDQSWFEKHEPQKSNREVIFSMKENQGGNKLRGGSTDTQEDITLVAHQVSPPAESMSIDNVEGQVLDLADQSFQVNPALKKLTSKPGSKRKRRQQSVVPPIVNMEQFTIQGVEGQNMTIEAAPLTISQRQRLENSSIYRPRQRRITQIAGATITEHTWRNIYANRQNVEPRMVARVPAPVINHPLNSGGWTPLNRNSDLDYCDASKIVNLPSAQVRSAIKRRQLQTLSPLYQQRESVVTQKNGINIAVQPSFITGRRGSGRRDSGLSVIGGLGTASRMQDSAEPATAGAGDAGDRSSSRGERTSKALTTLAQNKSSKLDNIVHAAYKITDTADITAMKDTYYRHDGERDDNMHQTTSLEEINSVADGAEPESIQMTYGQNVQTKNSLLSPPEGVEEVEAESEQKKVVPQSSIMSNLYEAGGITSPATLAPHSPHIFNYQSIYNMQKTQSQVETGSQEDLLAGTAQFNQVSYVGRPIDSSSMPIIMHGLSQQQPEEENVGDAQEDQLFDTHGDFNSEDFRHQQLSFQAQNYSLLHGSEPVFPSGLMISMLHEAARKRPIVSWSDLDDDSKTEMIRVLQRLEQLCPNGQPLPGTPINDLMFLLTQLSQVEGMPGFAMLQQKWYKNHCFVPYVANQSARLKKISMMAQQKRNMKSLLEEQSPRSPRLRTMQTPEERPKGENEKTASISMTRFNQTIANAQKKMNVEPSRWMPTNQLIHENKTAQRVKSSSPTPGQNKHLAPNSFKVTMQQRAAVQKTETQGNNSMLRTFMNSTAPPITSSLTFGPFEKSKKKVKLQVPVQARDDGKFDLIVKPTARAVESGKKRDMSAPKGINSVLSLKTLTKIKQENKWTQKMQDGAIQVQRATINQINLQQIKLKSQQAQTGQFTVVETDEEGTEVKNSAAQLYNANNEPLLSLSQLFGDPLKATGTINLQIEGIVGRRSEREPGGAHASTMLEDPVKKGRVTSQVSISQITKSHGEDISAENLRSGIVLKPLLLDDLVDQPQLLQGPNTTKNPDNLPSTKRRDGPDLPSGVSDLEHVQGPPTFVQVNGDDQAKSPRIFKTYEPGVGRVASDFTKQVSREFIAVREGNQRSDEEPTASPKRDTEYSGQVKSLGAWGLLGDSAERQPFNSASRHQFINQISEAIKEETQLEDKTPADSIAAALYQAAKGSHQVSRSKMSQIPQAPKMRLSGHTRNIDTFTTKQNITSVQASSNNVALPQVNVPMVSAEVQVYERPPEANTKRQAIHPIIQPIRDSREDLTAILVKSNTKDALYGKKKASKSPRVKAVLIAKEKLDTTDGPTTSGVYSAHRRRDAHATVSADSSQENQSKSQRRIKNTLKKQGSAVTSNHAASSPHTPRKDKMTGKKNTGANMALDIDKLSKKENTSVQKSETPYKASPYRGDRSENNKSRSSFIGGNTYQPTKNAGSNAGIAPNEDLVQILNDDKKLKTIGGGTTNKMPMRKITSSNYASVVSQREEVAVQSESSKIISTYRTRRRQGYDADSVETDLSMNREREYSIVNLKPASKDQDDNDSVERPQHKQVHAITHDLKPTGRSNLLVANNQRSVEIEANYASATNFQQKHEKYWQGRFKRTDKFFSNIDQFLKQFQSNKRPDRAELEADKFIAEARASPLPPSPTRDNYESKFHRDPKTGRELPIPKNKQKTPIATVIKPQHGNSQENPSSLNVTRRMFGEKHNSISFHTERSNQGVFNIKMPQEKHGKSSPRGMNPFLRPKRSSLKVNQMAKTSRQLQLSGSLERRQSHLDQTAGVPKLTSELERKLQISKNETFNITKDSMSFSQAPGQHTFGVTGGQSAFRSGDKMQEQSVGSHSKRYQNPSVDEDDDEREILEDPQEVLVIGGDGMFEHIQEQKMREQQRWIQKQDSEFDEGQSISMSCDDDIARRQKFVEQLMLPEVAANKPKHDASIKLDPNMGPPLTLKDKAQEKQQLEIKLQMKLLKNQKLKEKLHFSRLLEQNKAYVTHQPTPRIKRRIAPYKKQPNQIDNIKEQSYDSVQNDQKLVGFSEYALFPADEVKQNFMHGRHNSVVNPTVHMTLDYPSSDAFGAQTGQQSPAMYDTNSYTASHSPIYMQTRKHQIASDVNSVEEAPTHKRQYSRGDHDLDQMMRMQLAQNKTQRAHFDPNLTLQTVRFDKATGAAFGTAKFSDFAMNQDRSRQRGIAPESQTMSGAVFRQLTNQRGELVGFVKKPKVNEALKKALTAAPSNEDETKRGFLPGLKTTSNMTGEWNFNGNISIK